MKRIGFAWPLSIGLLLAVVAGAVEAQDTYNRVPLSDSASATVERADNAPAPTVLAPFVNWLEDAGVNFRGSLIEQAARNPAGGVEEGHTNVGQFNAGLDLNLQKLVGLPGGIFHFVV